MISEIWLEVPEGCQMTIVSDSCHSGGLIDEAKGQIGESHGKSGEVQGEEKDSGGFRNFLRRSVGDAIESRFGRHKDDDEEAECEESEGVKNKSLPLSTLIELLKQKTGKEDIDVGKLRPTLFDVFGEDASPKVKKFMNFIFAKIKGGNGEGGGGGGAFMVMVGGLAQQFLQQKLEENEESYTEPALATHVGSKQEAYAGASKKELPETGILIAAARPTRHLRMLPLQAMRAKLMVLAVMPSRLFLQKPMAE